VTKAGSSEHGVRTRTHTRARTHTTHLQVTHGFVLVGGQDDVGVLNHTAEVGIGLLSVQLQLQEAAVHLVDGQDGLDAFTQGLAQHRLGLHAHSLHAVYHHQGSVCDTQRGCDLGGEIDVAGRVDEVHQVVVAVTQAGVPLDVLVGELEVQRDAGGLDGDATVLLILPRVRQPRIPGLCAWGNERGTALGVWSSG